MFRCWLLPTITQVSWFYILCSLNVHLDEWTVKREVTGICSYYVRQFLAFLLYFFSSCPMTYFLLQRFLLLREFSLANQTSTGGLTAALPWLLFQYYFFLVSSNTLSPCSSLYRYPQSIISRRPIHHSNKEVLKQLPYLFTKLLWIWGYFFRNYLRNWF